MTMDKILQGLKGTGCFYDDVVVEGRNDDEHDMRLEAILSRFSKHGIQLRVEKCKVRSASVQYLGFMLSCQGVQTKDAKAAAIFDAPAPADASALKSFLGCVNFYTRFIPNMSTFLQPLNRLLGKNILWEWTAECTEAFGKIKQLLCQAPILCHYEADRELILERDASPHGIGACLMHEFSDGTRRPVCYVSHSLGKAESHYSQTEPEALTILFAIKCLHSCLYGRDFRLRADHKPLLRIFGENCRLAATAVSRLQRWVVIISGYDYVIEHPQGHEDCVADYLSRIPLKLSPKQESAVINAVEDNVILWKLCLCWLLMSLW